MLIEKINDLNIRMEKVYNYRINVEKYNNIRKTNNSFFEVYNKLKDQLISYKIASTYFSFHFNSNTLLLQSECNELCYDILFNKKVYNLEFFKDKVSSLSNSLENEWNYYILNDSDNTIDKLKVLSHIAKNKNEINSIISNLFSQRVWPVNVKKYDQFALYYQKAVNILSATHFDSEIETFIKKLADKKATVNDLTEKIVSWLKNENLEKNIILSVKSDF